MTYSLFGRWKRWLLVIAVVLILLLTAVATSAAAPANSQDGYYYTVRYGDTLSRVAQNHGVSMDAIIYANPHIGNPNLIFYGTVLFIPTTYYHPPTYPPHHTYGCRYHHYVSWGESLGMVGAWYGVSPYTIAQVNHIYNINYIYAGQYLCIP